MSDYEINIVIFTASRQMSSVKLGFRDFRHDRTGSFIIYDSNCFKPMKKSINQISRVEKQKVLPFTMMQKKRFSDVRKNNRMLTAPQKPVTK